jgi:hypothetical protein
MYDENDTVREMGELLKAMDQTDDFDTYLELSWRLNFLEQGLSSALQDFDLA